MKGTLQKLEIFEVIENSQIVSTGTAQTGLKGAFLARRLYENGQLGQNGAPLKITFMDDGINNHPPFITAFMQEVLKIELESRKNNAEYVRPSQIEFDCIWIKRPDDNPHAGTDNSHGKEATRLRTIFGAPNPQDMREEMIEEVQKADLIQGQRFGESQVDFRYAIRALQEETMPQPSLEQAHLRRLP